MRVTIVVFFCALLAFKCAAQEPAPFDGFNQMPNGEFIARVGNLYWEIDKTARFGIILLDAPNGQPDFRYMNERRLRTAIGLLRLDPSKVKIRFARQRKSLVEFWTAPTADIDIPAEYLKHDYVLDGLADATLIDDSRSVDDELGVAFNLQNFANFLNANPTMAGRMVIFVRTKQRFRNTMIRYLGVLVREFKVNRRQLRFIYHRDKSADVVVGTPGTELWIDPPRRLKK